MGGYVSPASPQLGPPRVWVAEGQGPGLAMSRSIGDHVCKHVGVIATPEVKRFELTAGVEYRMCLASDGVWEFIDNDEAMAVVMSHADSSAACVALIDESSRKWREEEGNYRDDITAIVCHLPFFTDDNSAATSQLATPSSTESNGKEHAGTVTIQPALARASAPDADTDEMEVARDPSPGGASFLQRRLTINNMNDESTALGLADLRAKYGGEQGGEQGS